MKLMRQFILIISCILLTFRIPILKAIVYPTSTGASWSIVNPASILCPHIIDQYDSSIHTKLSDLTVYELHMSENIIMKGHLCHKVRYTVVCEENFIGTKTTSHQIHSDSIHSSDCIEAIESYKEGELIEDEFPAPVCHYMEKTETSHSQVYVTPHDVQFDPYTEEFIDPIFLSGKTKGPMAETIHKDVKWIQDGEKRPSICSDIIEISGFIFTSQSMATSVTDRISHIQLETGVVLPINKACYMTYCGIMGLKFPHGEWFGFSNDSADFQTILTPINLNKCSSNDLINPESLIRSISTELQSVSIISHLRCLETISKIMSGEAISQYDISFLSNTAPGLGIMYWINSGKIYQSKALYKEVIITTEGLKNKVIGRDVTGKLVVEENFYKASDNPEVYYLPNGFTVMNGTLIIPPGLVLKSTMQNLLLKPHSLIPIHHPIINIISNKTSSIPYWPDLSTNGTSIPWFSWEGAIPWWLNWKIYLQMIFGAFMLILTILLLINVLKKICQKTFSSHSRSSSKPREVILMSELGKPIHEFP